MKKFSLKTRKSSHPRSNDRDVKKLLFWILVVVILVFGLRSIVSTVSSWVTTPFFSLQHYIETSSATVPVFIRSRDELLTYIRSLEQEIAARQGIDNTLGKLTEENESLRALLQASGTPRIAAGVIARPPHTPYDVVLIDRGSSDGIQENTPVYYGKGKILGYVQKIFSHQSLVTLISSPSIETSVYVFGPDIFVQAFGQGGGVVRLNIPQGIPVKTGDLVVTPSIEGGVLGSIEKVESNPTEPDQYAYLTYDVPIQSIRIVSVGTESLGPISFDDAQKAVSEAQNEFLKFDLPTTPDSEDWDGSTTTSDEISETI